MKPAISSAFILAFVALCGLDASPSPKQEVYVAEAVAKSPLCDCVACKCDPCVCGVVDDKPSVVNPNQHIVELYAKHENEIRKIWMSLGEDATMKDAVLKWLEQKSPLVVGPPPDAVSVNGSPVTFTQPQPAAKPKPVAAIARPQAVSYGSCGPGGCGQRRGLFGRRR